MSRRLKGSITIFLALLMMTFFMLCLVLVEGVRIYFLRVNAAQAMELAEFSALSEYQRELFEHYGLFFLDLDYEQGREQVGILEGRLNHYLNKNIEEIQTEQLKVKNIHRATDAEGKSFVEQAVSVMKMEKGSLFWEKLIEDFGHITPEDLNLGELLVKNENVIETALDHLKEGEKNKVISISIPDVTFPSVKALRDAVFGEETALSEKSIDLSRSIQTRDLSKGEDQRKENSFLDLGYFHRYLFQNFGYYGDENPNVWDSSLEYQLEYMISGKDHDLKNLENVMWKIFLLRAGGNYLFYRQDSYYLGEAKAEAIAMVGFLGNPYLIEAVTEILLLSRAIEEGITQTRQVFLGEKVPLYEKGIFSGILLGYEEYLYLFLKTEKHEQVVFRCMDLVEREVRERSKYEDFRLDHCTDRFEVQWNYRFDSLFHETGYFTGEIYKNEINRKVFYEN